MSVADDLKSAKRWLSSPRRWTKGSFFGGDTRETAKCACTMGACAIAAGGTYQTNYEPMLSALDKHLPEGTHLAAYNDDPNTTFEDIHALFDRAIQSLETTNA